MKLPWHNRSIKYTQDEIDIAVLAMQEALPLTQGKYLELFENRFQEYLPAKHAFAVSTGSSALDLSAILLNIEPGDEVLIPAHTWCATAISFARQGANVVWMDINPETFVVDLDSIKKTVSPKTKAIVIVHLYGLMCPMEEIVEFCKQRNIIIIEDCAQSLGASIDGQYCGSFGDISMFSFHANKNISTLGEGGMITVNSDEYANEISLLKHNGVSAFENKGEMYWKPAMSNILFNNSELWPYNYSIGEVQCAVGYKLIDRIDELNTERNRRAKKVKDELSDCKELVFQKVSEGYFHAYHCLVAYYDAKEEGERDQFMLHLWKNYEIQAIVQNCPLYRYPLFIENGLSEANCPNTDQFFDNMVSFPFYVWMEEEHLEYMINSIKKTSEYFRK